MKTETSIVAEQVRLQQWAEQIRDCQNRPADMDVASWCRQNGITKANYYYRLKRVRKACLDNARTCPVSFVELPAVQEDTLPVMNQTTVQQKSETAALIHCMNGVSVEIYTNASSEFIRSLIGAAAYVE